MNNFVFLTSEYEPNCDANGVCVKNISRILKDKGNKVYYICEGNDTSDNSKIINVKPNLIKRFQKYVNGKSAFCQFLFKVFYLIRKTLLIALLPIYPNVSPLRANKIYKKLLELSKKTNINCIIACHAPYDNIAAINKFKKNHPDIKSIVIYFDLISGRNPFGKAMEAVFEKLCLKSECKTFAINDFIFIPDSSKEKYMSELYDFSRDKLVCFDFPLFVAHKSDYENESVFSDNINIVYTGSIDGMNRNAEYFLKLAENLVNEYKLKLMIHFIGTFGDSRIYTKYKDAEFVKFYGQIKYEDVFKYINSADFLLNISNKLTYKMVPSKIFQMFASRKRIINIISHMDDYSVKYFDKYYSVCNIFEYEGNFENDAFKLKAFLESKLDFVPEYSDIEKEYIENKPETMAEKIMKCNGKELI